MRTLILVGCSILGAGLAIPAGAQSYGNNAAGNGIVHCESTDGRTRECPADTSRGIRMVRQISRTACIEGQTWGASRGGIWVTQGCRADFASGYGSSGNSGYGAQVLRCESSDGRHKQCPADTGGGVELVRQLSRSACLRNQSWGTDHGGVWVSQGCRAEFRIGGGQSGWDGRGDGHQVQVVRCESPRGSRNQCRVDVRGGVRLLRQLSSMTCAQGRTWGYDRGGIWVSHGCRADFEIGFRPGNGWGWGQDNNESGYDPGGDAAQVMRCESNDGDRRRCDVSIARGAQMVRQLSRSPCIEGQSWGWDRNGLWVSNGCRAEFSVW